MQDLTDLEKIVLESIVRSFISNVNPVASSYIAKNSNLDYSPATIRNVMASLEEKGYINQPHTSAGRVPTAAGYRLYVNRMMKRSRLSQKEKETIRQAILQNPGDFDLVMREAARILALLSSQLGVIVSPQLEKAVFHRMDINTLSSQRMLLVLYLKTGLVRSIVLEFRSDFPREHLESLRKVLNERLHGLTLKEIRSKFKEIVKDIRHDETGLIPLFMKQVDHIFNFSESSDIFFTGTHHILRQPEFINNKNISEVVELLEDRNLVVHLLKNEDATLNVQIKIGDEIGEQIMNNCSIVLARYQLGEVDGTIGVIGPMRMDYSHLVPLVGFTADLLSDMMGSN